VSYQSREITVEFVLAEGKSFDDKGSNILTIKNGQCFASIAAYGGVSGTEITLQVWGLSDDYLSALSYKGIWINGAKFNRMRVWASDRLVFEGFISDAYPDYSQLPDVPLIVAGNMMFAARAKEVSQFSASGDVDIASIIRPMAASVGLSFENAGATGIISNPHFRGNAIQQMLNACNAVNVNIDIGTDKVTIWPRNAARGGTELFISPENGLIGYPGFTDRGLSINTIFTPEIYIGRQVRLETSLPNASGQYRITGAQHNITSNIEGGQWVTSCTLIPLGADNA